MSALLLSRTGADDTAPVEERWGEGGREGGREGEMGGGREGGREGEMG